MATQLTAILPDRGRVAIADAVSRRPLHLAWGLGDGVWLDDPSEGLSVPPPEIDVVDLMNEYGRRVISEWKFVVPDDAGSIIVDTGRFSLSPGNAPTNNLYVNCQFDFVDGVGAAIREVALYTNTELIDGLPEGQRYFSAAEVREKGFLLYLQNINPIFRSSATQEYFETVITF